jgi:ABC-type hemin transport system ATPase subunit
MLADIDINKNSPKNRLCVAKRMRAMIIDSLKTEFSFAPRLMLSFGIIVKWQKRSTREVSQYFSEVLTQFCVSGLSDTDIIKSSSENKRRIKRACRRCFENSFKV